jgi:glycosyltransferase involved in cell wall biosynthesis
MKSSELKILYVCLDFPYPPLNGGLVDMWNRIQALHRLGVTLDVVVTNRGEPSLADRTKVESVVRRLIFAPRQRTMHGLLALRPGQTVIRSALRRVQLEDDYDVVILHTEFCAEILHNATLRYRRSVIRVDNDEYAFYRNTARSERSWLLKFFFLQEAFRIKFSSERLLESADMLWFISSDELGRYKERHPVNPGQVTAFVPTAIDMKLLDRPSLLGSQVLFIGNLWAPMNRRAVEWYVEEVHPLLSDIPEYVFVIAGSTRGRGCNWMEPLVSGFGNIRCHYDPVDLTAFYRDSAVFVNPMQSGAGVKLKTMEAVLRGLPVVSTTTGAEGSGLIGGIHYDCAGRGGAFAEAIRRLLADKGLAQQYVERSQEFLRNHYDQEKILAGLLEQASECAESARQS